jgi:hypothetical protein
MDTSANAGATRRACGIPIIVTSHNVYYVKLHHSSLIRVQRWSAALDYSLPRLQLREALVRCNAFQEESY